MTPGYQLGHYRMSQKQGKRRSVFKVDVNMGGHATAYEALEVWPKGIARLQEIERISTADKLQGKLDTLRKITCKEWS